MTTYEWATRDKNGEIATWNDYPHPEKAARDYVANRIRFDIAKPGEEKVLFRAISKWKEAT